MGDLESQGFSIEVMPKEDKTSLYEHKDGRVVRLPSDPRSLKYYLRKGLTLYSGIAPPEQGDIGYGI